MKERRNRRKHGSVKQAVKARRARPRSSVLLKRGQPAPKCGARRGVKHRYPGWPHPNAERPRSPTGIPEQVGRGGGNREASGGRGGRNRASGQGTAHCGGARPRASREKRRPGQGSASERRPPPPQVGPGPAPARPRAGAHQGAAASIGTQRDAPYSPQAPLPAGSAPAHSLAAGEKSPPAPNKFSAPLTPTGQWGYPIRAGCSAFCPMETRLTDQWLTLDNRKETRRRCGGRQRALDRG